MRLAGAIGRAREHHPLIVSARRRISMIEAERLEAGLKPNPSLTISGENFPLESTAQGFDLTRSLDWFVTYSQTFETGGKRRLRVSMAERDLDAARAAADLVERQVIYEVKAAYQLMSISRLRVELLRDNLNNLQQLVGLNEIRVREGYTSEGDLIKVRLEAQRFEYLLRKSVLESDRARIALLRAIGGTSFEPSDLNFDVVDELSPEPVVVNPVDLRRSALNLPEVQVAQARVDRLQAHLRLEEARARPDLTASIGYKRNGPDNTLYAALSVPLPLYNRNQAQIARSQAELELAQSDLRQVQNLALAEIASARRAVEMNQEQVRSLRADFLLRADEARTISLAAYREGAADLLVLLDSQRVRSQAQELYFQTLYDYQLAIHELERAAGIERLPRESGKLQTAQDSSDEKH